MEPLKEVVEKLREIQRLSKLEKECDSKKQSKEYNNLISDLQDDIDSILYDYVDQELPMEIPVTIQVNKKVIVPFDIDAIIAGICTLSPEDIEKVNITKIAKEQIAFDFDWYDYICNDDVNVIFDD